MITHYEEVKLKGKKSGNCICGKWHTRSKTFSQTISPFNKRDGRQKTRDEIMMELQIEKEDWEGEPPTCNYPGYWQMTQEQRDEYDKEGIVVVKMDCGHDTIELNPNYQALKQEVVCETIQEEKEL